LFRLLIHGVVFSLLRRFLRLRAIALALRVLRLRAIALALRVGLAFAPGIFSWLRPAGLAFAPLIS
jgi:hypothetical protein